MLEEKIKNPTNSNSKLGFLLIAVGSLVILFFSSTYFMSYWWAHALTSVLACLFLKKISKYYISWILIANAFFFSNQPRFSLEFILVTLGLSAWAFSDQYLKISKKQKIILILSLIGISLVCTAIGKSLNENNSLLAWVAVLISLYFPIKENIFEKKNLIASSIATVLVLFSSKKSVILGFFAQYLSAVRSIKSFLILTISALAIFLGSFLFQDDIKLFYNKSISPRLIIWQSTANGFIHKPLTGNGFGIFPMEINTYRESVRKIGGKLNEHLNHAHNNLLQVAFEQGLVGLSLYLLLFIFLFTHHRSCFWAFLTLSLLDANLVYSTQYFFAALIFVPSILEKDALFDKKFFVLPHKYQNFAHYILLLICLVTFSFSVVGHYYYEKKDYATAIKFDPKHSLYQFFVGVENFKKGDYEEAIDHFENSVALSKNHGFQQGFLAVTYHLLHKRKQALKWVSESIRLAGDEAQWKYIAHFIYKATDPEYAKQLKFEALTINPVLKYYEKGLVPPKQASIGGFAGSNNWVNSYQRRGEQVFIPIPRR